MQLLCLVICGWIVNNHIKNGTLLSLWPGESPVKLGRLVLDEFCGHLLSNAALPVRTGVRELDSLV